MELLQHAALVRESRRRPCASEPPGAQHCRHVAGLPPCENSHSALAVPGSGHAQSVVVPGVPHTRWQLPPWQVSPCSQRRTPVAPVLVTHFPPSGMSLAQRLSPELKRGFTESSARQYEPDGHEFAAPVQSLSNRRLVDTQTLLPPTFVHARFSPHTPGAWLEHVGEGLQVSPSARSGAQGKLNPPPHWRRMLPLGQAAIPHRSRESGVGIGATPQPAINELPSSKYAAMVRELPRCVALRCVA